MRYQKVLEKRGNLPRREVLEKRRRRVQSEIASLETQYLEDFAELEAELSVIDRSMMAHTYSTHTLQFLRDIEENVPAVSGVYGISVDGKIAYVGESQNVQKRCLDHAESIVIPQEKAAAMYRELGMLDPDAISFGLLEEVADDKKLRCARETHWARYYTEAGCALYNVVWRGKGSVPAEEPIYDLSKLPPGIERVVSPEILRTLLGGA